MRMVISDGEGTNPSEIELVFVFHFHVDSLSCVLIELEFIGRHRLRLIDFNLFFVSWTTTATRLERIVVSTEFDVTDRIRLDR